MEERSGRNEGYKQRKAEMLPEQRNTGRDENYWYVRNVIVFFNKVRSFTELGPSTF